MANAPAKTVEIRPKKTTDWMGLIRKAELGHWRKIKVTVQFREKLYAGKPKQLDAAKAMLKARGLEEVVEILK